MPIGTRRQARMIALQALYEYDIVQHPPKEVVQRHAEERHLQPKVVEYANELVIGVIAHLAEIDAHIQSAAREWPLQQMARIDKNIPDLQSTRFCLIIRYQLKLPSMRRWSLPNNLAATPPVDSLMAFSVQYFIGRNICLHLRRKVR